MLSLEKDQVLRIVLIESLNGLREHVPPHSLSALPWRSRSTFLTTSEKIHDHEDTRAALLLTSISNIGMGKKWSCDLDVFPRNSVWTVMCDKLNSEAVNVVTG